MVTQEGLAVSPRIWWFNRIITCSPPCKGYLPRGVYYTHLVSNVSLSLSPCMYTYRQVYTMWSEFTLCVHGIVTYVRVVLWDAGWLCSNEMQV